MNVPRFLFTPTARVLSHASFMAAMLLPYTVAAQETPAAPAEPPPIITAQATVALPEPAVLVEPTTVTEPVVSTKGGIVLNFQGASLSDVLNYLSEAAGFVIVTEAPVSGTVNIVSRQGITPEETVDLLNSVLYEKGYTAIRNGRILKIVSRTNAPKRDLPVEMGSDPDRIPRNDEMVTQILPLRFGEAAKLIENLRPLLADNATISSNDASNAILLTDTQNNIRRIAQIIRALDTSVESISGIHIFPLQFADAKEVANVISQLFAGQSSAGASAASQGRGGRGGRGGFGFPGFGGGGGQAQAAPPSEAKQAASRVVAVADEQSNSLIVSAPEEIVPTIRNVITQIDTSITDITDTRIFRLLHADAVELAELVNNLYSDTSTQGNQRGRGDQRNNNWRGGGGQQPAASGQPSGRALLQARVVAVGDPRTNSLIVTAASESMLQVSEVIGRLDATPAKKQRVFVHSLQHADAENVATVLRGMLGQQTTGAGGLPNGTSRLTERTATGATMDANEAQNTGRATR